MQSRRPKDLGIHWRKKANRAILEGPSIRERSSLFSGSFGEVLPVNSSNVEQLVGQSTILTVDYSPTNLGGQKAGKLTYRFPVYLRSCRHEGVSIS